MSAKLLVVIAKMLSLYFHRQREGSFTKEELAWFDSEIQKAQGE